MSHPKWGKCGHLLRDELKVKDDYEHVVVDGVGNDDRDEDGCKAEAKTGQRNL